MNTDVGSGIVSGGWEYVAAAYAICWIILTAYTVSLWTRRPHGDGR